jgi:hypothetical protein
MRALEITVRPPATNSAVNGNLKFLRQTISARIEAVH